MSNAMYPIYNLDYHKCLNCGSNSVVIKDRKGYANSMIYPVLNMECKKCGEEFYIKWIEDPNNNKEMIPVATGVRNYEEVTKKIIYEAKEELDRAKNSLKE